MSFQEHLPAYIQRSLDDILGGLAYRTAFLDETMRWRRVPQVQRDLEHNVPDGHEGGLAFLKRAKGTPTINNSDRIQRDTELLEDNHACARLPVY